MKKILLSIVCSFLIMDAFGLSSQALAWWVRRPIVQERIIVNGGVSPFKHPIYCANHPLMCR